MRTNRRPLAIMRRSCSDSLLTASQSDGVFGSDRTISVAWPRVDGQHVFHSGYERAVGLRRDDPVLAAMGLKNVFLSARPIVLSLARSTMPSSTTLFSNSRK